MTGTDNSVYVETKIKYDNYEYYIKLCSFLLTKKKADPTQTIIENTKIIIIYLSVTLSFVFLNNDDNVPGIDVNFPFFLCFENDGKSNLRKDFLYEAILGKVVPAKSRLIGRPPQCQSLGERRTLECRFKFHRIHSKRKTGTEQHDEKTNWKQKKDHLRLTWFLTKT